MKAPVATDALADLVLSKILARVAVLEVEAEAGFLEQEELEELAIVRELLDQFTNRGGCGCIDARPIGGKNEENRRSGRHSRRRARLSRMRMPGGRDLGQAPAGAYPARRRYRARESRGGNRLAIGERMMLRLRYLNLKLRALCWVLRRLRAGRSVSGAPRAVWARQLQPESIKSNLASALRT